MKGMVSIFTYGFNTSKENFEKAKCKLFTLCNYDTLINVAVEKNYVKEKDIDVLKKWRIAPEKWGAK